MNILILTGKFGMGHLSASYSLCQQIRAEFGDASIEVEDLFEYAVPEYAGAIYQSFRFLVSRASGCYTPPLQMHRESPELSAAFPSLFYGEAGRADCPHPSHRDYFHPAGLLAACFALQG
jgi:hypothetical protein